MGKVVWAAVLATAILDRLLHHSRGIITIRGESYHLRERRRPSLLKSALPVCGPEQAEPSKRPTKF